MTTKKKSPNGKALVFEVPGPEEPGYLRRIRQARAFLETREDRSLASLDAEIEFVLNYVSEPADREEARELLLDASELQYAELLEALNRKLFGTNPT